MKKIFTVGLLSILFCFFFFCNCYQSPKWTEEEKKELLKGIDTVRLFVIEHHLYNGHYLNVKKLKYPLNTFEISKIIFGAAGITVVDSMQSGDVEMRIIIEGSPVTANYQGLIKFTGAQCSGSIVLYSLPKIAIEKSFSGYDEPSSRVGANVMSKPEDTFFDEALWKPNSFAYTLIDIIRINWGKDVLLKMSEYKNWKTSWLHDVLLEAINSSIYQLENQDPQLEIIEKPMK